ncbi:chromosomal replication initiator protein DnaA [Candidatus Saccharibacteria bacterium]|nr:chromosomal replication initiator protein DnaA [Candidatus Saccharibacteria bacterium]
MDVKALWQAALGELEVTLTGPNFKTWFSKTSMLSNEDGNIVIAVPNVMTKQWLETKFSDQIHSTLRKMTNPLRSIEYKIDGTTAANPTPKPNRSADIPKPKATQSSLPMREANVTSTNLNPKYVFESFVVGSSNEFAHAASQAVAKAPGEKYNPLFIYGPTGLGKTHLMQAVGNEIHRRDPSKRIEYVTSETFTNEFISGIMKKKTTAFAEKYRAVDVLIIDDIQFLARAEKTQDEFFHTFNTLHQANKQIIISSDKPPQALMGLEERLRSRCAAGITVDVQPPDLETRAAILQTKAAAQGLLLPVDVIDYLIRHAQVNVRELEGALTQLLAYCEMRGVEPTVAAATQLLAGQAAARPKLKPLSPKLIIDRVASYFDLQTADIIGTKRDKEIVVPRQIVMYIMRHDMSLSYPKIAANVGGRDHTTAMHSVTKIEKQVEVDDALRGEIEAIREQLAAAV